MNTLVVFHSYSGSTKSIAEKFAADNSFDIAEVKEMKRPGKLKAYTSGIFASLKGKPWPIKTPNADFEKYERLVLYSPVWAGNPTPAFNAVLGLLPQGKSIDVKMVSKSGKSDCMARVEAAINAKGSTLEGFENIKS